MMSNERSIRLTELTETDLPFVLELYNYYTLHSTAVYFIEPITLEEVRAIVPVGNPLYRSFLIRNNNDEAVGFCYFNRFKEKPAFRISVEVTLYLHPDQTGKGFGGEALCLLEPYIQMGGFTNAVALIDSANDASIRLFKRHGYECCASIRSVAEKGGELLTLEIYQKLFK